MPPEEEENQWPPNANVITFELRRLDYGTICKAPALIVTTRAMRGNLQTKKDVEEQEEYSSDEAPHLSDLERIARTARIATKALEVENEILQDRERPNIVHNLEGSEMGEWKGPRILLDEFDGVRREKKDKPNRYVLWANLSLLKADITFGQLLQILPMARKTLKEGMPVNRRTKKVQTRYRLEFNCKKEVVMSRL